VLRALQTPGLTSDGKAWLAKALHPSDTVWSVNGIPTMESVPTASLNFQNVATITAPAAAAWNADVVLAPTPLYFAKVHTSDGAAFTSTTIANNSLGVTQAQAEFGANGILWNTAMNTAFWQNVSMYRITYASMTITMSAAATTDEGSVTCGQYPVHGTKIGWPTILLTANPVGSRFQIPGSLWCCTRPNANSLLGIGGSVSHEAKKGVYMILKLDEGCLKWRSATKPRVAVPYLGNYSWGASDIQLAQLTIPDMFDAAAATDALGEPWFGPYAIWANPYQNGTGATSQTTLGGRCQYEPACGNIGHCLFSGLDPAAKLVITVRVGFEFRIPPGSVYVGQVGSPVPYDPVALQTYYAYAREYLSAYPAEFNILGAIWTGLKAIGRPILGAVTRLFGESIAEKVEGTSGRPSQVMTVPLERPRPPPMHIPWRPITYDNGAERYATAEELAPPRRRSRRRARGGKKKVKLNIRRSRSLSRRRK